MRAHYRRKKRAALPYFAKRAEVRRMLEDTAALAVKEAQGLYDVVVIDPPWPVHQNMAEDHTCKGGGECHPYREFEGMQPSS